MIDHIHRFGPAICFQTEAFESYNAIIRAWSIHSNHHAPSHDIALSAAAFYRVRHIISGGYILHRNEDGIESWAPAGPGALSLADHNSVVSRKIGLHLGAPRNSPGKY